MALPVDVDCESVGDLMRPEEIVDINQIITEPLEMDETRLLGRGEKLGEAEIGGPEFEVARSEDYHQVANPGILETLVETKLPYECRENSDLVWLATVMMYHIAENQAFYEGNKRTAYFVGALFLIKGQLLDGDEAVYPFLDRELTDKLSLAATRDISRDEFYRYLEQRLSQSRL